MSDARRHAAAEALVARTDSQPRRALGTAEMVDIALKAADEVERGLADQLAAKTSVAIGVLHAESSHKTSFAYCDFNICREAREALALFHETQES